MRSINATARAWMATAAMVLLGTAGCAPDPHTASNAPLSVAPAGSISIYQFAGRLGLRVARSGASGARLTGDGRSVAVFADPGGRVLVDGRQVGKSGGIRPVGDMLFLPEGLAEEVASAMPPPVVASKPKATPPPQRKLPKPESPSARIVIDPGHGGRDPGARSRTGTWEKSINLDVSRRVASLLRRRGLDVLVTRDGDQTVELEERADYANRKKGDLYVSLHADWAENRSAQGFTLYVCRGASSGSVRAAEALRSQLSAAGIEDRGVREADFRVLVQTKCPAVLVEMGYLSNRQDAMRLQNDAFQDRMAAAIATGILDYLQ